MRLTGDQPAAGIHVAGRFHRFPAWWTWVALAASLVSIFEVDHETGSAPVQHLYYLPIILASVRLGRAAGLSASFVSVLLYHLANPALIASGYREADVVQIALFVVVAIVAAKLSDDARRLHELAMTDDLTGLHNLRSFESRLTAMIRASRVAGTQVAMLVMDVDRLKSINDAHGHLAGAEAVRAVGHVLKARLPASAVACRYGGDEFAVAIAACGAPQAERIADSLRAAVHTLAPVLAGERFPIHTLSISIGVACSTVDAGPALTSSPRNEIRAGEALFRAADEALYAAKARGRNQVGAALH